MLPGANAAPSAPGGASGEPRACSVRGVGGVASAAALRRGEGDIVACFCLFFFQAASEKERKEQCDGLRESEKRGREMDTPICADARSLCLNLGCLENSCNYLVN